MRAAVYDWMYRLWAPWDSVGIRKDLVAYLEERGIEPSDYPRAIDLGCGTGANVVHLAGLGFDSWGIDFSEIALRNANDRARAANVTPTFVLGDLTAESVPGVVGPFDLLIDFGTLDDLKGEARQAMADLATHLSRRGSRLLEYCFYGERDDLPWISFKGTSKLTHIAPGELERLFGDWDVEPFALYPDHRIGVFELIRR